MGKLVVALIDDDEEQVREISRMIQQNIGFEVVTAKDGIDGLVLLKQHAEDLRLCLVDMVMPGISGIELLNRARADRSLEHVTFALMTEFSSGSKAKKTLSHFQVTDDRGRVRLLFVVCSSSSSHFVFRRTSECAHKALAFHLGR